MPESTILLLFPELCCNVVDMCYTMIMDKMKFTVRNPEKCILGWAATFLILSMSIGRPAFFMKG